MLIAETLKKSILQAAIQGKLTEQLPTDGSAKDLLAKIKAEKQKLTAEGKIKKEKPLAPITDDEKPFEIPENWEWVRLGEVAYYKKGPFGSALTKGMFVPKGEDTVKVYEQKNAIQKDSSLGSYYIKGSYYRESMSGFTVSAGDIIVSCAGTIGETYILPEEIELGIINQALMRIRLFVLLPEFYLLVFGIAITSPKAKANGSAIKNIPPFEILKNIPIPLPPLSEQKRIVERVEELFAEIEKLEKDEKQLEELQKAFPTRLKNSLLQAAMQGKLTEQLPSDGSAKELLAKIKAEKQKLIAEGKIKKEKPLAPITDDEKPFEIPENWDMTKAGNVFTLWDGQKVSDVNLPNLDAKFLRTNANATYLTEGKFVKAGQTMILVDGENSGEVFIPNVDGIQGSTFKLLEISKAVDTQYALFFLSFYREYLRNNKKGAAIPHLNKDEFKKLIFPLPPIAEQKRIVAKLEELLPLCEDLAE